MTEYDSDDVGGRPHRRPPRRRVSPAPFFLADCGGLYQSINLLLFLQKQNLAIAIYLFGLGTLLTPP